ncbi:MAG TPA: hypothetical protein VHZ52_01080 [Acidobacteriaceae bacterium]|nr:hypothetical protein [Acidobacteriaceae bacterium]
MSRNLLGFYVAACAAFFACATLPAQQPNYNDSGPVPSAIPNAKTIFVSNAGADSGLFPEPFSGDPNRAYAELYSSLKASGKYEMASDPSEADLVLEVQLTAPNGPTKGSKVYGASDPVPMVRLVIYDRKSHYALWAITESIEIAFRQKTHDRNFDDAIAALVAEFERISGKLPAAAK